MEKIWTKEKIESALQEVVGKSIGFYDEGRDINPIMVQIIKLIRPNSNKYTWSLDRKSQVITYSWCGYGICHITYKKKMREKKKHYWESQKYLFKSLEVSFFYKNSNCIEKCSCLEEAISEAEKHYEKANDKKKQEYEKAKIAYNYICEKFGKEQAFDVIYTLKTEYYKLKEDENSEGE